MSDEERFEYEVTQEKYYEDTYNKGFGYALKEDSEFLIWLEQRRKEDSNFQMEDTHETAN